MQASPRRDPHRPRPSRVPRARGLGRALAAIAAAAALPACGASASSQRGASGEDAEFSCNERSASYVVVGSFVAPELGVEMSCAGGSATLVRWTVAEGGERDERSHAMSKGDFDDAWQQLHDAGWRYLRDCDNPGAADADQVYTFEIADADARVAFKCQGKSLPFPYDRLSNALDTEAAKFN